MKTIVMCLLALLMLVSLTACNQAEIPAGQTSNIPAQNGEQSSTVPTEDSVFYDEEHQQGMMNFAALDNLKKRKWSDIDGFDHIDIDDSHALFDVKFDNYEFPAVMYVAYDKETDVISEAVIDYNGTTVDALSTDAMQVARRIMVAMEEAKNATTVADEVAR